VHRCRGCLLLQPDTYQAFDKAGATLGAHIRRCRLNPGRRHDWHDRLELQKQTCPGAKVAEMSRARSAEQKRIRMTRPQSMRLLGKLQPGARHRRTERLRCRSAALRLKKREPAGPFRTESAAPSTNQTATAVMVLKLYG
jgi:hypothetical protein